jgi:hypothetical protein
VTVLTSGIDVAAQACTPALAEKLSTLQTLTVLRERLGERIRFAELADALKQLAQPRVAAQPASRTKFKGLLELGGGLKLRVAVYSKVIEKKLKSPKTFSLAARDYDYEQNAASGAADGAVALADADPVDGEDMPATDSVAARWAVSKETGYATAAAQLVNVPPEGVIRAYKFGQDYVPVDNIQAAHFKFLSGAKCLQLVGFVADGAVPRTHLLGGVDVLTADKDDEKGAEALAALVQAVAEEGSAMLLRFIPRANAPPRAALCVPCAEDVGGGKTAFYFIMHNLPFSDEVRSAVWPAADASSLPTAAQLAAAAALVDSMMLASAPSEAGPSGDESAEPVAEPLCPETTPNPYIQHVNRVIMQRALAPGTPLADLDPALAAMVRWPAPACLCMLRASVPCAHARASALLVAVEHRNRHATRVHAVRAHAAPCSRTCALARALPSCPRPQLDWDPSLKARSQAAGAEFEARCPWALVKAGDSGLKRTRAFAIVDAADGAVAPSKRAALDGAELEAPSGPILLGGTQARSSIGRIDPVADLQRMLNDRVSDLTQPALEQMSAITLELAADVRDDGARALALACVEALRDACLDRLEPTRYNNTLQAVREATGQNEADGAKLWSSICARPELTLISSAELDESEITPQEATLYLAQASAAATQPFQPPPPASSALAGDVNVLDDLE